jgi:hypothetical protein
MSIEVEVLSEVYTTMKQYISQKDRQEVADNLMSVMVDVLNDLDLKEFAATDAALTRAFKEYSGEEEDDYEDYEN